MKKEVKYVSVWEDGNGKINWTNRATFNTNTFEVTNIILNGEEPLFRSLNSKYIVFENKRKILYEVNGRCFTIEKILSSVERFKDSNLRINIEYVPCDTYDVVIQRECDGLFEEVIKFKCNDNQNEIYEMCNKYNIEIQESQEGYPFDVNELQSLTEDDMPF